MFRIGGNTFYDRKKKILKKIPESKRSEIGVIVEFCEIPNGFPTLVYRRTAAAMKMASFLGVFVDCCLFACCPGGRWGNTEQVVTQCQHPVASGVALDMTHWAMSSVSLQRTAMAIKTSSR
jgi:hypothetical protein